MLNGLHFVIRFVRCLIELLVSIYRTSPNTLICGPLLKANLLNLFLADGSEKLSDTSPGAASISSVDIANEFASLSSEEQDRVRSEWSQVCRNKFQFNKSTLK